MLRENIEPHKLKEVIEFNISKLREILDQVKATEEKQKRLKIEQKDLDHFQQFSMILELHDLPELSTKYGEIVHALIDIKNMGYDPKVIISKYKQFESLIKATEKLKVKLQEEEKLLQEYKRKSNEEGVKWKDHDNAFKMFTRLVKAGLKAEDIFTVAQIVINDYTRDKMNQLIEDIRTYGSIHAAKSKLKRESEEEDDFLV